MRKHDCNEVLRIWTDEAAGQAIGESERELVVLHLERCARCRAEARALEVLAADEAAGRAAAVDELTARRLIDQALAQVDAVDGDAVPVSAASTSRRTVVLAAAIAAVVTFGLSAGVFLLLGDRSPAFSPEPAALAAEARALAGAIRMTAGEVQQGDATASSGDAVAVGERLVTGSGRAAVGIETGVDLLLEARTEIEVRRLDGSAIEVFLRAGRIIAHVEPVRAGPPVRIATTDGAVEVSGTAFAVEARGERVAVQVFRGSVKLDERQGSRRVLRLGQAAVLGQDGIGTLTSDEIGDAADVLGLLELISDADRPVIVEVKSWPSGATVAIDNRVIGETPLSASVRAGHRRLELSLAGHESVREHLALGKDELVSRTFELQPASDSSAAEPADDDGVQRIAERAAAHERGASDPPPRAHQPTAEELLEQALTLRAAKNWPQAAAAYEELIMRYPGSNRARAALVSLGRIQLDHLGRPESALRTFDSYLALTANGSLAQEAAFGRAVAFRRLGRRSEEIAALQDFLRRFPAAIQADRARARLVEIASPNS